MEVFLSAVLGELATRSVNFFISKHSKPSALDLEDRLRRVLLRAQVIVDEAMERQITSRAMLKQLELLREAIHRGYYTLDTFTYQSQDDDEAKDHVVSHFSLLSKINSIKDLCFFSAPRAHILEEMNEILDRLSSMILEPNELVIFLKSYPRMHRQPYSMHLLLGNCMFSRQMEIEVVISFLLHAQHRRADEFEVLPIVGPGRVGKSSLVARICNDERVRDHFSEVVFLNDHDLRDEKLYVRREGCALEHQNCALNKDGRLLVVVEVAGDLNEDAWRNFCLSKLSATNGGKIIITSRSDKITKLGTTGALTLKYLSNKEYWYFFKTLAFGSTNPDTHPRMVYLAMEMARMLNGSLVGGNIAARLLRDHFDIQFWCKVLAYLKRITQKCVSKFGESPCDVLSQSRAVHFGRMASASEEIMVHHQYQLQSQEEIPKIMFQDVMCGRIQPHGKFEALAWRSQIPPYYSFVYTCEIREIKTTGVKRKRSVVNRVTLC